MPREQWLYVAPKDKNGTIEWSMSTSGDGVSGQDPGKKFPWIKLPHNKGRYLFHVQIEDEDDLGIKFAACPDAIWIEKGTRCPTAWVKPPEQITDIRRENSQLTFVDRNNGDSQTLTYRLNFVDRDGRPVAEIDPEIRNGGGTGNIFSPNVAFISVGAATGAIVGFGAAIIADNSLEPSSAVGLAFGGALVGLFVGLLFEKF